MSNADTLRQLHQDHLSNYNQQEQQAIELMGLLNKLYNEQDVQVTLFGDTLDTTSVGQILALHQKVALRDKGAKPISVADTLAMVKTLAENKDIQAARIDVGQLIANDSDLQAALESINNDNAASNGATDVVLYGFGRIGRILTRLLLSQASSAKGLQLKAIVVRPAAAGDLAKRASLLERDSIHGSFAGGVVVDDENNGLIINGRFVQVEGHADRCLNGRHGGRHAHFVVVRVAVEPGHSAVNHLPRERDKGGGVAHRAVDQRCHQPVVQIVAVLVIIAGAASEGLRH